MAKVRKLEISIPITEEGKFGAALVSLREGHKVVARVTARRMLELIEYADTARVAAAAVKPA